MKISHLFVFWIFTLSFIQKAHLANSQSVLSQIHFPQSDSSHYFSYKFRLTSWVDTSSFSGLIFPLKSEFQSNSVYIKLAVSGALLGFSSIQPDIPIPIERKIPYRFHTWRLEDAYEIRIWKTNGKSGFVRCQWLEMNSSKILDEIFICLSNVDLQFKKPEFLKTGGFRIE